jgi:hypothetical protein
LRSSDRDRCNSHAETTFFQRAAGDDVLDDLRAARKGDVEATDERSAIDVAVNFGPQHGSVSGRNLLPAMPRSPNSLRSSMAFLASLASWAARNTCIGGGLI